MRTSLPLESGATALLAALALLSSSITETWSRSSDLARRYPGLAARKAQLGAVAVVADVAEFEVENGRATWIYVDDCRAMSRRLADSLATAMAAKGYRAQAGPVLSVGMAADSDATCRTHTTWAERKLRDERSPRRACPFALDSTLAASAETRAAWTRVTRAVREGRRPKHGKPVVVAEAMGLRGLLGADIACIVVGLGTKSPRYSAVTVFGRVHSQAEPSPYPGSSVRIALLDCATGEVLWTDEESDWLGFSEGRLDRMAHGLADTMP